MGTLCSPYGGGGGGGGASTHTHTISEIIAKDLHIYIRARYTHK